MIKFSGVCSMVENVFVFITFFFKGFIFVDLEIQHGLVLTWLCHIVICLNMNSLTCTASGRIS